MIIDSRTGKILVTSEQLLKDVKKYLSKLSTKELRKELADFLRAERKEKKL